MGTTNLPIGDLSFIVGVATTDAITIEVAGVEKDVTSRDDPLPAFRRVFTVAQGFGLGPQRAGGSNEQMSYTTAFEIREAIIPPDGGGDDGGGDDGGGDGKPGTGTEQ